MFEFFFEWFLFFEHFFSDIFLFWLFFSPFFSPFFQWFSFFESFSESFFETFGPAQYTSSSVSVMKEPCCGTWRLLDWISLGPMPWQILIVSKNWISLCSFTFYPFCMFQTGPLFISISCQFCLILFSSSFNFLKS